MWAALGALLSSLGISVGSILAWIEARRLAIKAIVFGLGVAIIVIIAAALLVMSVRITSSVSDLLSLNPDVDLFSVANTIFPLQEVISQMFLIVSVRIGLIIMHLVFVGARWAWNVLSWSCNAGE